MSSVSFLVDLQSCQYLPSDWVERLLRKPIRDREIISTKPRPKCASDFFGLAYCFIFYCVFVPTQCISYSYGTT